MSFRIRKIDYFHATVNDKPGEAYNLLAQLAGQGVSLLAFSAVPVGPMSTQLTLFPEESAKMGDAAARAGIQLFGPHPALLVQGDDELGALADVHEKLYKADVNVYASSGVTDGAASFGYVLYVRPDEFERAVSALEL